MALRAGLSPFITRKIPGTHFRHRLIRPPGQSAAERIRWIENSNDLNGNRTRYLPACSIVLHPIMLQRVLNYITEKHIHHSAHGFLMKLTLGFCTRVSHSQ
jgi:hypothetical protein